MNRFPAEFADLLSPRGRAILKRGYPDAERVFHGKETPLALLTGVLDSKKATACRDLLDKTLYDHLRAIRSPIPPEALTGMTKNYEEQLPKTMSFKTAYFASRSSLSYRAAAEVGLLAMLRSESLAAFAEAVTGIKLERKNGVQAILYEAGGYVGPHNDHHPEDENCRDGFVDLHITLANSAVANQYLVCEDAGFLSKIYPVTANGSVAVYRLPFWHYTTPLIAKTGRTSEARRWLLLGTFDIDRT